MKRLTFVEVLIYMAVISIVTSLIFAIANNRGSYHYASDGSLVVTVEIDGHQYLKCGDQLTHSASCKACLERERR